MGLVYKFKSPKLQAQFEELLKDPDKLELGNEIQLLRMCLAAVVAKVSKDTEELENITGSEIAALAGLAKEIHDAVETMARVESKMSTMITIEQLMLCAEVFAALMMPFVPVKDHDRALDAVRQARLPFMNPHGQKAAARKALAIEAHPWNAEKVAAGESQQFTAAETQARPTKAGPPSATYRPKVKLQTNLADDGELEDWDPNDEQPDEEQPAAVEQPTE